MKIEPDIEVNASGIQCPGPIMKMKDRMTKLERGQVLKITATDPGFKTDTPAWCQSTGNRFLGMISNDGVYTAYVRKGLAPVEAASPAGNGKRNSSRASRRAG